LAIYGVPSFLCLLFLCLGFLMILFLGYVYRYPFVFVCVSMFFVKVFTGVDLIEDG